MSNKYTIPEGYSYRWRDIKKIPAEEYQCGYCGKIVASEDGWYATSTFSDKLSAVVVVCPSCKRPSFVDDQGKTTPGTVFGDEVDDIPDTAVKGLYDEARKSVGEGCYTAAVLCCRKLLMHIAVEKGAELGKTFISYVEFLSAKHFIPPDAIDWVDHIRTKGNEANHEISIMNREDAEQLVSFIEMILKVIFEFPASIKKKKRTEGSP
jgi:hypothetical protein